MRTVTESVQLILAQSPFLAEALSEGIVNYSAVARKLKPDLESMHARSFTEGAIIMALKKLEKGSTSGRSKLHASSVVRGITVHSNLVQHAFKNSAELHRIQGKLLQLAGGDDDTIVSMARGTVDTGIIVSESLEERLKQLTAGEKLIKRFDGLASLSIRFHHSIVDQPGIYYPFFQTLAWKGIGFTQLVTGFAELTFLCPEKDIDRAFSAVKAMLQKPRWKFW